MLWFMADPQRSRASSQFVFAVPFSASCVCGRLPFATSACTNERYSSPDRKSRWRAAWEPAT
ncbi:MAG: hypothetical protein DMD35_00730 [Gemmatimonadetes bacterium]|nr:MAG: hypothetical protein DMD35_00730 [Gemmatimonadota bacterium]